MRNTKSIVKLLILLILTILVKNTTESREIDYKELFEVYVEPKVPESLIKAIDSLSKSGKPAHEFSMSFYLSIPLFSNQIYPEKCEIGRIINFGNSLPPYHPAWLDAENNIREAILKWRFKKLSVAFPDNPSDSIKMHQYCVFLALTYRMSDGHFSLRRYSEAYIFNLFDSKINIDIESK